MVVDGGCLSARSSQGGGRARLNERRQVLIVKEHRRGGVSDYRPGSECYRVNRGSRRAVMAANWRVVG